MGIEPTYPAWKAGVLPLNYTRKKQYKYMFASRTKIILSLFLTGVNSYFYYFIFTLFTLLNVP